MVGFFGGRLLEMRAQARVGRCQGLRRVEGLGADLAHVIDAHQRRRLPPFVGGEMGFIPGHDGAGPRWPWFGKQSSERAVGGAKKAVHAASLSAPMNVEKASVLCRFH